MEDPALLMREMHSTGYAIAQRALGRTNDLTAENQVYCEIDSHTTIY